MEKEKLDAIIESHGRWIHNEGGERANLRGADLREADLRGANLRGADLWRADLWRADLRRADLRGADLREVNLRGADLRGADLRGANLQEKIVQVGPIGSRRDYTVYWVDRDIVRCGCWNEYRGGSLEEFKSRIDEVYPGGPYRQEYLAAIAMFEKMRVIE